MHLAVRAAVAAVDVRDVVRLDEEPVERGVERGQFRVRPLGVHARKRPLPCVGSRRADTVEIEVRHLGGEVPLRAVDAHERIADLDDERRAVGEVEAERKARRLFAFGLRGQLLPRDDWMVERDDVGVLARDPARAHRRADHASALDARVAREDRLFKFLPADAPLAVDEQRRLARVREAVDGAVRRGGRLRADTARVERDGVVARLAELRLLAEGGRDVGRRLARERHEPQVAEVPASRSAQVRLREAENAVVLVAVARTVAVALASRVGRRLDQPERIRRAGERVPIASGADLRPHSRCTFHGCADARSTRRLPRA